MNQILVVEDDAAFNKAVSMSLSDLAKVISVFTVHEALDVLNREPVSVVVTDYKLTGPSGLKLVEMANQLKPCPPIILMTAFAEKPMLIESLNLGVFALVEKPFHDDALRTHVIKALAPTEIATGEITLMPSLNSIYYNSQTHVLTRTEYELASLFIARPNQWLTRDAIETIVWPAKTSGSRNNLDTHLSNLKRKLPFLKERLHAVRGTGYIYKC